MANVTFEAPAWVSFVYAGRTGYGLVDPASARVADLSGGDSGTPMPASMLDLLRAGPEAWETAERRASVALNASRPETPVRVLDDVRLTAPVPSPRLMLGLGGNYAAYEENYVDVPEAPRVFQKPVSAVAGPCDPVRLPTGMRYVQPELELCAVIGRRMTAVEPAAVPEHVFGYTVGNDVTAVDPLMTDWVWRQRPEAAAHGLPDRTPLTFGLAFHAKAYDTFAPMGPGIVRGLDPEAGIEMRLSINGETAQSGNTADMLLSVAELVSWISHVSTLEPGDVIWTGALPNLPALADGDVLTHSADAIGSFTLTCLSDTRYQEAS